MNKKQVTRYLSPASSVVWTRGIVTTVTSTLQNAKFNKKQPWMIDKRGKFSQILVLSSFLNKDGSRGEVQRVRTLRQVKCFAIIPSWPRCTKQVNSTFACSLARLIFKQRQRTKHLLLRIHVVFRISNMKISRRPLAACVKKMHRKACSTIIFPHSTNQIIDLWRCRCRRHFLNSIKSQPQQNEQNADTEEARINLTCLCFLVRHWSGMVFWNYRSLLWLKQKSMDFLSEGAEPQQWEKFSASSCYTWRHNSTIEAKLPIALRHC